MGLKNIIFYFRNLKVRAVFFPVLLLWAPSVWSQESPERYVVDHWTTEDGLPVNAINDVIQSQNGYIWMATFDGVVRFDGIRFKTFTIANYPTLSSNRILRITELDDGSIWMLGEQRFLVRYLHGKMERMDLLPTYHGKGASKFFKDYRGWLWIGADQGLNVYRNGKLEAYLPEIVKGRIDKLFVERSGAIWYRDGNTLTIYRLHQGQPKRMAKSKQGSDYNAMLQLKDGSCFLSTGNGVYHFQGDSLLQHFPQFRGKLEGIAFYEDANGSVLLATTGDGLFKFQGDHFEKLNGFPRFEGLHNHSFFEDEQENLWQFSRNNIYKNGKRIFTTSAYIKSFTVDREGSIWLATGADGLYRVKPTIFNIYSTSQGLPDKNIYPILEARDGSIWLGTHNSGIVRLKNGTIKFDFLNPNKTLLRSIRSMVQLHDGTILIGHYGAGIFRVHESQKNLIPINLPKELQQTVVYAMFEDSQHRLWIGSKVGLFLREDNRWTHFTNKDNLPHTYVRYVTEAPDGSIWFATNGGGISRYLNNSFITYRTEQGLSTNLIREIHIEPGNDPHHYTLWIGTEGRGLNRIEIEDGVWKEPSITYYTTTHGLFDNGIHRILNDDNGFLWMNSNRGIFRVSIAELEAFHRGEIDRIQSVGYTEKDGLLNREGNGGIQPAGIKTRDGTLWFPTQNGAVEINPNNIKTNKTPPPVVIESVISHEQQIWNEDLSMVKTETKHRDFEINYTALSLLVPEKNEYRYKLEGFDKSWQNAGNRRTAFYTNVPPGEYVFRVIATNNNGVWNEEGASLSIIVLPFFYETNWFYGICAVVVLGLIVVGVRLRTRRLAQAERQLSALIKERTEELRLEKQKTEEQAEELKKVAGIKSRFFANISHELRTPLTLIINPLKQLTSGTLGTFSETVSRRHQLMLRNSYRLLRLIDQLLDLARLEEGKIQLTMEEIELVPFTTQIVELFELTAREKNIALTMHSECIGCRIIADPDKLEKVIANLLSNAIKYTNPGGCIEVTLRDVEEQCEIEVRDNGIGISHDQQAHIFDRFYQVDQNDTRRAEGAGIGLAVVREFVELHGGQVRLHSQPEKGSRFIVIFPKKAMQHPSQLNTSPVITNGKHGYKYVNEIKSENLTSSPKHELHLEADVTSILIVEDHTDLRSFLKELLSDTYRVFEASNGNMALEMIRKELPDLIVADIMMPGMDGRTLNLELKKDPVLASIPLIFLTAKAATEEKIKGFSEGADEYLTKPFEEEVLLARIHNLIESRMRLRSLLLKQATGVNYPAGEELEDAFLATLNDLLETSYSNPNLSISNLANRMYIDRTQLYRKLKSKKGLTPQQYVLQFRLNKAAMLFQKKQGSVSEVAYAVGFNSLSYFARQFREQFGVNPSEYIEKIPNS